MDWETLGWQNSTWTQIQCVPGGMLIKTTCTDGRSAEEEPKSVTVHFIPATDEQIQAFRNTFPKRGGIL